MSDNKPHEPTVILHMDFDEDPLSDGSGNNHTGALKGAGEPNFTSSGKFGGAYVFDGADDYVSIADHNDLTPVVGTGFTYILWLKSNESAATIRQVGGKRGAGIPNLEWVTQSRESDGFLRLIVYDATEETYVARYGLGVELWDNVWHLVAFVWDGGTTDASINAYIDTVQVMDTNNGSGTFVNVDNTATTLRIGDSEDAAVDEWLGTIDEPAYINRTLSAEEIYAIYHEQVKRHR